MGRFEDERGIIEDLFGGEAVNVTLVTTRKGAVRGNHYHRHTDQWTLITVGRLLTATDRGEEEASVGRRIYNPPGQPHAWKALEDSYCLVFTRGPRAGDYESDTHRLKEPLL